MVVLLDTNVLIDYFGRREPFYEEANNLKVMSFFGDVDLWTTSNSLTDVFYVLHKEHPSEVVQQAFLASKGHLGICSVTADNIYQAAAENWGDFEDCLVDVCAQKLKANYILTRDASGFGNARTPCLAPSEFLDKVADELGLTYAEIAPAHSQTLGQR